MDDTRVAGVSEAVAPYKHLASYRRCVERIAATWPAFRIRRAERLRQGLYGPPVEKVAENILEDLCTTVLDWSLEDVVLQVGRADVVLSELGVKRLVLEVKRPGTLLWRRRAVDAALEQARRYAAEQSVDTVAISDGSFLYAADVTGGGLRDRVLVGFESDDPPDNLWWVSVHGIYRSCPPLTSGLGGPAGIDHAVAEESDACSALHPKYKLPLHCFAFVGAANDPRTWKLPYLLIDGAPDTKRLPKAIQSILTDYRGAKVSLPREAVADVLVRLGKAAASLQKMPCQSASTSTAYVEAHHALVQLERLDDVGCC